MINSIFFSVYPHIFLKLMLCLFQSVTSFNEGESQMISTSKPRSKHSRSFVSVNGVSVKANSGFWFSNIFLMKHSIIFLRLWTLCYFNLLYSYVKVPRKLVKTFNIAKLVFYLHVHFYIWHYLSKYYNYNLVQLNRS